MVDRLQVLALPWVFSQSHPLSTSDFIAQADRRGVNLDAPTLRELHRRGDLHPLVEITSRAVTAPIPVAEGPSLLNGPIMQLRNALASGRVRDLAESDFRPRMRFDESRTTDRPGWQNGLIYSQWQLLVLPELERRLDERRVSGHPGRPRVTIPQLNEWSVPARERITRWALVLTALEPRYLPEINPEWHSLVNIATPDEWDEYCQRFNPIEMAEFLEITPDEVTAAAEYFLSRARSLDGTGEWSRLIRRAPRRAWTSLRGDILKALDHRMAAEVLLLFHEDLVSLGAADPLPELGGQVWHPRAERLSDNRQTLDSILNDLGVSPHPGAVLVVEGEVEERIIPRVFDHLGLRRTADVVHLLCMRGANKDLTLVAAATAAPILGQRFDDAYEMIRPPTHLVVAVDQDEGWDAPEKVTKERNKILDAIAKVVKAQGGDIPTSELDGLVVIRTWNAKCFEFAHFTDNELADAMIETHHDCGGLDRSALIDRIRGIREKGLDIKAVWDLAWNPKPVKPALADALWPILAAKIDQLRAGGEVDVPQVVEVVREAYLLGQQPTLGTFVIRAASSQEGNQGPNK